MKVFSQRTHISSRLLSTSKWTFKTALWASMAIVRRWFLSWDQNAPALLNHRFESGYDQRVLRLSAHVLQAARAILNATLHFDYAREAMIAAEAVSHLAPLLLCQGKSVAFSSATHLRICWQLKFRLEHHFQRAGSIDEFSFKRSYWSESNCSWSQDSWNFTTSKVLMCSLARVASNSHRRADFEIHSQGAGLWSIIFIGEFNPLVARKTTSNESDEWN